MRTPPRYRQVAEALRADITAGVFSAGDALPTEKSLCDRYRISRHTAREALRLLSEDGLIERRQGAGSIVADRTAPAFVSPTGDFESILQYAREATFVLLSSASADAEALAEYDLKGHYRLFTGLRRIDDELPLALNRILIEEAFAPDDAAIDRLDESVSEWIERHHAVRIEEVTQRMDAVCLDAKAAESLAVATQSPALRTVRRYRDAAGGIVMLSHSLHPAGRFAYTMKMSRRA
ncbi:MAG: GntR family transcriptional regulator [Gammaproteobacteria bacterium]